MDLIPSLLAGMIYLANYLPLLMIVVGVVLGILIGVLPGLSPSIGVALLLPATYNLDPFSALVLLVSVYLASNYGGSITAIAINTPGTPGAVATTFDGYQLTRQGKPGTALAVSLVASTVGGIVGTLILIAFSMSLAKVALQFESYEFFALGVFGLTIISSLSGNKLLKGVMASLLGLLLATIGFDAELPFSRFSSGIPQLADGMTFIPALIGLFALGEIFFSIEQSSFLKDEKAKQFSYNSDLPGMKVFWGLRNVMLRSSLLGTLIGSIPGAGGTIATFIAYDTARSSSKTPEKFGKGALEGVAAPEAANNASVGGALIPLLTLGIPGSASTAVLVGALMVHKLSPGPELFTKQPGIVYGLYLSLLVANVVMFAFGLLGNRLWVRVIAAPKSFVFPIIIALSFVGSYFVQHSLFDAGLCLVFGVLGWLLRRYGFPTAPVVLGLILGPMVEENLRLSLMRAGPEAILTRPIALALLALSILSLFAPQIKRRLGLR